MCVVESGPLRRDREPSVEQACDWVRQAAAITGMQGIAFIGGEPFLRRHAMEEVTAAARDVGLAGAAISNAYWASSTAAAERTLERLAARGLRRLTVSTDWFHQKFVSLDYVETAIRAAASVGLACNVNWVRRPGESDADETLARLRSLPGVDGTQIFGCLPVGRARNFEPEPGHVDALRRCSAVISTLTVKPWGDVFACCGVGGFTPALRLGNLHQDSLAAAVARGVRDPLIRTIAMNGPAELARLIEEPVNAAHFVDECHLCHQLLASPTTAARAREACDAAKGEIAMRYAYLSEALAART
jgi:MoaA/NifB/PqqE/SkfB family radical SAM enzyme